MREETDPPLPQMAEALQRERRPNII